MTIPGKATQGGTAAFRSRFNSLHFTSIPRLGLEASRIGFGTFRLRRQHATLLENALLSGINFIDTASHFRNGEGEQTIGEVLSKGIVKREVQIANEEVIICTKAGFIFGEPNSDAIPIKSGNYHSIAPEFLEQELSNSLKRLNLESIDLLLLNNPERMLQCKNRSVGTERLYEMIAKAFEHLEKEVQRGRIAGYGIASNSVPIRTAADSISMERIYTNLPHLVAVQYPFNLYERHAIEDGFDGALNLAEYCRKKGLFQMLQRPFNSITPQGVRQLVTASNAELERDINEKATEQFAKVTEMEFDLASLLGSDSMSMSIISKFVVAQILAENLSRLVENAMAAELYINRDIIPALEKDLEELKVFANDFEPEIKSALLAWALEYRAEVLKLTQHVIAIGRWHSNRSNEDLHQLIALYSHRDESLAVNSLAFCLSSIPDATVLCGMQDLEHLKDAIRTLQLPLLNKEKLEFLTETPFLR
jgi:aryl-alcohol dehydrogenase-like predicted oxidoreductase